MDPDMRFAAAVDERQTTVRRFRRAVNMTADELAAWLRTQESRAVGEKPGGGESIGHASGRRIVELLRADDEAYDDADLAHMRRVIGFVARHAAQRPRGDVTATRWRYSLMNWGHDPLREPAPRAGRASRGR
jgi:hypothetical protein